jgi:protein CpxP
MAAGERRALACRLPILNGLKVSYMKKTFVALAASLALTSAFATSPVPAPVAASAPASASAADTASRGQAREARVEQRIDKLHAELKITAAQDPQWTKFADVMRDNGRQMGELYRQRAAQDKTMSALDDMKQYQQITQTHAEDTKRLVEAFEPLYASLSPEQQKLADVSFRQPAQQAGRKAPGRAPHKKPSANAAAADAAPSTQQ